MANFWTTKSGTVLTTLEERVTTTYALPIDSTYLPLASKIEMLLKVDVLISMLLCRCILLYVLQGNVQVQCNLYLNFFLLLLISQPHQSDIFGNQ